VVVDNLLPFSQQLLKFPATKEKTLISENKNDLVLNQSEQVRHLVFLEPAFCSLLHFEEE
jgi:hypothetical protein